MQVGLLELEGTRPLKYFLNSAAIVSPGFTNYWQNRMMDGNRSNVLDFYRLINKLHEYWAENMTRGTAVNHGAFSVTLNGRDANGRKPCLCDKNHRFS